MVESSMTILITGATGHLGTHVIDSLLAKGVPAEQIRAGARSPEKITTVPAVHLDYEDAASVAAAMDGVEKVLLISASVPGTRVALHKTVIDAAAAAGVQQLVYTSVLDARDSALILAPEHKATEELIEASGVPATILRNGWYTENYLGTLEQAKSGAIMTSTGDGRVASASRKDYADAAAAVLTEPGHEGQVYELSGDVAWSFDEFAAVAAAIVGSPVAHRSLSADEHAAALAAAGLDEGTIGFLVGLDGNIRDGLLGVTPGELSRLIGRPTTPLAEGLVQG
jgi:NAD(P)H dehydrogenase (quinone)